MKMNFLIILFVIISSIICESLIIYEEIDNIGIITLNRTRHLNALNTTVFDHLLNAINALDTSKISALIITGAGEKAFVAGADIYEMSTLSKRFGEELSRRGNEVFRKIETLPIPVIAAVNGYALGGGVELAMSCDIRICSTNAVFGMPEVKLGINPGFGGTQRLSRLIGQGMAKQMIYGGNYVDALEALRIGLVNAVHPQGELIEQAMKLAKDIAKNGRNAVASSKRAINEGMQVDIESGIKLEEKIFGECFENDEQVSGMKNFLDKSKKGKKKKSSEKEATKEKEKIEEEKKKEEDFLPKGDLLPTTKFLNMTYLKEIQTPVMPAILSVGNKNLYNSMTIEWGSLGVAFKKPIFTVYVKPDRYTYEVMEKSDIFTVNFIERKLMKKFAVYGTKSGKDINKEEEAGTHIKFMDKGGITFDEAVEVYVCKKMAKSVIDEKSMDPYIKELYRNNVKVYRTEVPHVLYIGEIIAHYVRES